MAGAKGTPQQLPLSLRDDSQEIWRSVVGYAGLYEVSNLGRVRSLDRFVRAGRGGPLALRKIRGRLLSVRLVRVNDALQRRYAMVDLYKENQETQSYVHTLVLEAFVGRRPAGYVCNHKDGNSENSVVENLEWVTQSDNILHALTNGLFRHARGEQMANHKLAAADVLTIRRQGKAGMRRVDIAKQFGVEACTVSNIIARRIWAHLPEE